MANTSNITQLKFDDNGYWIFEKLIENITSFVKLNHKTIP